MLAARNQDDLPVFYQSLPFHILAFDFVAVPRSRLGHLGFPVRLLERLSVGSGVPFSPCLFLP